MRRWNIGFLFDCCIFILHKSFGQWFMQNKYTTIFSHCETANYFSHTRCTSRHKLLLLLKFPQKFESSIKCMNGLFYFLLLMIFLSRIWMAESKISFEHGPWVVWLCLTKWNLKFVINATEKRSKRPHCFHNICLSKTTKFNHRTLFSKRNFRSKSSKTTSFPRESFVLTAADGRLVSYLRVSEYSHKLSAHTQSHTGIYRL